MQKAQIAGRDLRMASRPRRSTAFSFSCSWSAARPIWRYRARALTRRPITQALNDLKELSATYIAALSDIDAKRAAFFRCS